MSGGATAFLADSHTVHFQHSVLVSASHSVPYSRATYKHHLLFIDEESKARSVNELPGTCGQCRQDSDLGVLALDPMPSATGLFSLSTWELVGQEGTPGTAETCSSHHWGGP